ncbi:hypothetical protein BJP40_26080 [Streptomyces sp. CC53]|nr:hypothetical protein BJP40_26080 [Streptomyces sp. CC53]
MAAGCTTDRSDDTQQAAPSSVPGASGIPADGRPEVRLPPARAGFDYQLGTPYDPPPGVSVVARDHTAPPAPEVYNICYVNAFQAQPGAEKEWDPDLLLRDDSGAVVMDTEWGEAMLDVRTDAKRRRIADRVNAWIDECAAKGYRAVEPDNYDTYTRAPEGLLSADDAKAFLSLLAAHAHEKGLAIGQKNTAELAPSRREVGADFAVVEECGQYEECADYVAAFGENVLVIEYTDQGMQRACRDWGDKLTIVRRDLHLVSKEEGGHLYGRCPAS